MLREEFAFARKLIDTLHDCVIILNTELNIQTANWSFFEAFDVAESETIGQPFCELGDGRWSNAELQKLLDGIISEEVEIRDFRLNFDFPNTGKQTLQINARRLVHNHQPWIVLAIENITRRLLETQELERFNTELLRSNEELEQFAFLAAHDLQAPLQTIISYLNLLVERYEGRLDHDANDFFEFTIDSATHLQKMTQGLLSLARVNQQAPQFELVDCQQIVDDVLNSLTPAIDAAQAVISNDTLPTVVGDRTQLTHLFQNLIDNAIKFRGEKPPQIHIGIREHTDEWHFSVQDDGVGIEPQYIEGIFEQFRRAHHHTDYAGSGLGLTIAKKIVERHGGRIWVESTPGKHTVFYFSIAKKLGQ